MSKKYIIFIDDEIEKHMELSDLKDEIKVPEGYELCPYTDPGKAFKFISANSKDISLIISDYVMPGVDGIFFLKQSMERVESKAKFVLITNKDIEEVKKSLPKGCLIEKKEDSMVKLIQKLIVKFIQ